MGLGIAIDKRVGNQAEIIAVTLSGGGVKMIVVLAAVYADQAPVMVAGAGSLLHLYHIDIGNTQTLKHQLANCKVVVAVAGTLVQHVLRSLEPVMAVIENRSLCFFCSRPVIFCRVFLIQQM